MIRHTPSKLNAFLPLFCLLMLTQFIIPQPRAVAEADSNALLEQKLEGLYQALSKKFARNPYYKNEDHPQLARLSHSEQPPEYRMLPLPLFKIAMKSYCSLMESKEAKYVDHADKFSFVNYSESATFRRLYVFDIKNQEVIHNTWTTHGIRSTLDLSLSLKDTSSGEEDPVLSRANSLVASFFSNTPDTQMSSTGMAIAYPTTYPSATFNSIAVRLDGVDGELNNKLLDRFIVAHAFDYRADDIGSGYIPTSEGCIMLQRNDYYRGKRNEDVSDVIIHNLLGAPILLYSERMNPSENERLHQIQLSQISQLQSQMEEEFQHLSLHHGWSNSDSNRYLSQLTNKLKTALLPRIEQTYEYFKTPSRFVGKEVQSPSQCMHALGID